MNNTRRNKIDKIIAQLVAISSSIDDLISEEDETRSNLPENLENSSGYEASENSSDFMENASSSIDEAIDSLENAK
jgi:ABC-type transporter Mla subunit MlaD